MLVQVLLSIVAYVTQGFAAPTPDSQLVARQGYTPNCTSLYIVRSGDTCNAIRDYFLDTFSLADFYSWNPQVNSVCSNLYVGEVVCVGVGNSTTPPAACPLPIKPGLISTCKKCYKVVSGDTCAGIVSEYSISLAQLDAWNPDINSGCTNLEIGYNYCVGI
ncbi:hypothetical protein F5Y01DRAFT_297788 [Xylaria sp. FL0043]|nr:hypothetical protein F5Y01DRAFT_297788 [Xylaria sp. FL0043]